MEKSKGEQKGERNLDLIQKEEKHRKRKRKKGRKRVIEILIEGPQTGNARGVLGGKERRKRGKESGQERSLIQA